MKELARRVLPHLSNDQCRIAAACVLDYADAHKITAAHLTPTRLETYLTAYFKDPLAVTRQQNEFIRSINWPKRKAFFQAAPLLNYLAEREAHVRPYNNPSSSTHDEIQNQGYLFHGDLRPGTRFILDRPSTHDREYLKIKKESDNTLKYTPYSRQLAAGQENNSQTRIAEILLDALREKGGKKFVTV
ncbi:hypothetical protein HY994_05805 [Candidatus Micrarchaeota archaeon]|nr:hypothetical protein [Candidatus Micrarchaeota archaeon]